MLSGYLPDLRMPRRRFLGLGAGALATVGLNSTGFSTSLGSYFFEPEVRRSSNGVLRTQLRAAPGTTLVEGKPVKTAIYEGTFPGPTLRVKAGELLQIELIDDLAEEETNLHTHGFHVSPMSPADNVLMHIHPGQRFTLRIQPPARPSGGDLLLSSAQPRARHQSALQGHDGVHHHRG